MNVKLTPKFDYTVSDLTRSVAYSIMFIEILKYTKFLYSHEQFDPLKHFVTLKLAEEWRK